MTEPQSPFDTPLASLDLPASSYGGRSRRTSMEYLDAYKSFFRGPTWGMNLLFLSLNMLIPIVGPIVVQGYLVSVIARQHVHGDDAPFEFKWERFGEFIGRGIWPFLGSLVIALIFTPLFFAMSIPLIVIAQTDRQEIVIPAVIGTALTFLIVGIVLYLANQPVIVRAAFAQGLSGVFSFAAIRDFISRMWLESLLVLLFLWATSLPLILAGYIMCGLGIYPAIILITYAGFQLHLQLYEVYLSKGGAQVEMKPELMR